MISGWTLPAAAQEPPVHEGHQSATLAEHAEGHEDHHSPRIEVELAGSSIFQSGGASLRLGSPLRAEIRYFGVEGNDIGVAGLGWELRVGGLRVIPGVAWGFGRENEPGPMITARWVYEDEHWISQGVWVQSLGEYQQPVAGSEDASATEEMETVVKYAGALDGIHVSRRFGRVEAGPMVEHIRYREENAWKGGGRVAVGLGHSLRLVGQVVGPGTEVRGGFAWEY